MKKHSVVWLILYVSFLLLVHFNTYSQNIGIGTSTPAAKLHVAEGNIFYTSTGNVPLVPGTLPNLGAGRRMIWYPDKAAFRVGYVDDGSWEKDLIGNYSFASGNNARASDLYSIAMGNHARALNESSIALGQLCIASGRNSVALGYFNNASGLGAVAIGYETDASGAYSLALGRNSGAFGFASIAMGESVNAYENNSVAIGSSVDAGGQNAIALGANIIASGNYSIGLGSYVSTSGFEGCLTIGDRSTTTMMSTFVENGFRSRFAGGYRLFTNSAATIGAFLNSNANSWAALSDVRLKENFLPVDEEVLLNKIAAIPQYTWNYIGQDVKTLRHYGPMAQDFYAAFGKDALGEIGCDTLINQQDFLGVNLIAIQALEKRTTQLKKETGESITMLLRRIELLEEQNKRLLQLLEEKRK